MAHLQTDRKILLVEDERLVAEAERIALEQHGYTVVSASSGVEAVQAVVDDPEIDLVLMDINLGSGMDGTEAAEHILKLRELPLVFLSSHTDPKVVARTERITSYGYIVKHTGDAVLDVSIKMAFRLFESMRRESEKDLALHTGRVHTRALMDAIPDLMFLFDRRGYFVDYRPAAGHSLLVPPEGFLKQHVSDALPGYLADMTIDRLVRVFQDRTPQVYTYALGSGDDERTYESRLVPCGTDLALSIVREVTDQERARATLERQSQMLRALVDIASVYIDVPSPNPEALTIESLARMGRSVSADRAYVFAFDETGMVATNTHEWCASDVDPVRDELQTVSVTLLGRLHAAHRRGEPFIAADVLELPLGELRSHLTEQKIRSLVTVPLMAGGRCEGFVGFDFVRSRRLPSDEEVGLLTVFARILVTATQRQEAERRAEMLLREKDLLLREAHHRVKNNLDIVRSLLSLKAHRQAEVPDESPAAILRDSADRVGGLAALYDRLYAAPEQHELNMQEFLPPLVREIVRLYDPAGAVRISIHVDPCPLNVAQMSPLGILINELITNSMKHAFPDRSRGLISIAAVRHGDTVALTYEDDGRAPGAAPRPEPRDTFGLQLVRALAEQLGGTITSELAPGSRYRLTFPTISASR